MRYFPIIVLLIALIMALPTEARERLRDRLGKGQGSRTYDSPYLLQKDVAYGPDSLQIYNVYGTPDLAQAPIIVMVHGGGWRMGDNDGAHMVKDKTERWVPKGFLYISVNYRLLPDAPVSVQIKDIAAAVKHIQANATKWHGDGRRIILMGHSAGGHLVSLLAANPPRLGVTPWLGTISLDSAALDVPAIMESRHFRLYDIAFGDDPAYWASVSPLEFVSAQATPWLGVCSSRRKDPCPDAGKFVAKLKAKGVRGSVLPQQKNHGQILGELGKPNDYTAQVEEFMATLDPIVAKHLKDSAP